MTQIKRILTDKEICVNTINLCRLCAYARNLELGARN